MKLLRGFSLVELMIAMVLGLIVIGGTIGILIANQTTSRTNNVLSNLQTTARLSFQLMSQDIHNAGFSGCNNSMRLSSTIGVNGARPQWAQWWPGAGIEGIAAPINVNGLNLAPGTEGLRLMYGMGNSNTISNYDGVTFTVNNVPVVAAGEVALACDDNLTSLFQVTAAAGNQLSHGVIGLNCDPNLGFIFEDEWACGLNPPRIFTPNSMLMRFESVVWFVAPSRDEPTVNSLYRASLVGDNQINEEVLFGVSDLQFAYLDGDTGIFQTAAQVNAAALNGAAWQRVSAVNVTVVIDPAVLQTVNLPNNVTNISFLVTLRNRV